VQDGLGLMLGSKFTLAIQWRVLMSRWLWVWPMSQIKARLLKPAMELMCRYPCHMWSEKLINTLRIACAARLPRTTTMRPFSSSFLATCSTWTDTMGNEDGTICVAFSELTWDFWKSIAALKTSDYVEILGILSRCFRGVCWVFVGYASFICLFFSSFLVTCSTWIDTLGKGAACCAFSELT